ncbi:hypothetical protein COOONC_26752 [Cooperia oncophora]
MIQYNLGCPLPDCKCGAPNCTGTLGATTNASAHEKTEVESNSSENGTKKRKKRSGKAVLPQEPPEKKTKSWSRRRGIKVRCFKPSHPLQKNGDVTLNGQLNKPTVTFRKASSSSRSERKDRDSPNSVRRSRNRRPKKTLNGLRGLKRTRQIAVELSPSNVIV